MQLINASVYEERAEKRQHDILETQKQKILERQTKRDKLERTKLYGYLKKKGQGNQVNISGAFYRVAVQGNKLEKFQGMERHVVADVDNPQSTMAPRRIKIAGVTFSRSKNGNYWRRGVVTAAKTKSSHLHVYSQFRSGDKKDKLCRYFTKTGTSPSAFPFTPSRQLLTVGSCHKGQSCRYIHDPDKLALCPAYLKDHCPLSTEDCPLSHQPNAHRSPACLHFNRGHCDKEATCRYAHIKTTPSAPVCRDFAFLGYCTAGENCDRRHVFECPDFTENGECLRRTCKLPHIDTATTVRKRVEGEATRKRYHDDVDDENSEEEDDTDEEEEDTESDVESEGVGDDGEKFEDQLDFMHL
jgi:hypothetical protein